MSESPQTPPPVEPTPPSSGGTGGTSASSFNADQMKSAALEAHRMDLGIIAIGVLAFIFSLFSYYKYSVSFAGISSSGTVSAWHGFFGWFAAVVALAASGVLAAAVFGKVALPFPLRLTVLAGYAVATLCVVLALFVIPGGDLSGTGIDKGHGFAYWISLLLIVAGLVLSVMRREATD